MRSLTLRAWLVSPVLASLLTLGSTGCGAGTLLPGDDDPVDEAPALGAAGRTADTDPTPGSFPAVADARVEERRPGSSFGDSTYLVADGDPGRWSYLRFEVRGIGGPVASARLRLFAYNGTSDGPAVYATSNAWSESGLTWSNRPAPAGAPLDDAGRVDAGRWVELDVTAQVRGDGTYSFVLVPDSPDGLYVDSREGASRPELLVAVAGAPPPDGGTPDAGSAPPDAAAPLDAAPGPDAGGGGGADGGTDAGAARRYLLVSPGELAALPVSGAAWSALKAVADGSLGTANIADQDNKHAVMTFGVALVYARTGISSYRDKAHAAILAAIGTEVGGRVLGLGRSLGAYVLAADLIDLDSANPADGARFRAWLSDVRTKYIGNHGRWVALTQTHEDTANNWGTFAGASRIAASLYLGDAADVARAAQVFRGWLGDRSAYAGFAKSAGYDASWACDDTRWTAVNPACVRSGIDLDGALVEDISRGGSLSMPPGATGMSYSWEALQGVFVQAELLRRAGYDTYSWSNQALRRAMAFMQRGGWSMTGPGRYVPWMANRRYGTSFPTTAAGYGRVFGFTDWLYGP